MRTSAWKMYKFKLCQHAYYQELSFLIHNNGIVANNTIIINHHDKVCFALPVGAKMSIKRLHYSKRPQNNAPTGLRSKNFHSRAGSVVETELIQPRKQQNNSPTIFVAFSVAQILFK